MLSANQKTPFGETHDFHAAFAELYPRLVSYARRYGATYPEDIAQEAFVILMQREEDRAGGVAIGVFITFASIVVASVAAVLERSLQSAVDLKSESDLTV